MASSPSRKSTSCAECRRLKLKCDRVFPCQSCLRRGTANICPTGTLEKGRRGFLKRLEQVLPPDGADSGSSEVAMFVSRDAAMVKRIEELEAALIRAGVPVPPTLSPHEATGLEVKDSETHLRRKRHRTSSPPPAQNPFTNPTPPNENTEVALGFGTLTIDPENQSSRYIGLSGGSSYLNADIWRMSGSRRTSHENLQAAYNFSQQALDEPSTGMSTPYSDSYSWNRYLPTHEEARRLCDLYFDNASFMYEVIPKDIFFAVHLPAIYPFSPNFSDTKPPPHVLALVSMVLALGAFFDLSASFAFVYPRAEQFYSLALLSISPSGSADPHLLLNKMDTIPAVQTLHLMALYLLSTRGDSGGDPAWQLLGMAVRSTQAMGLHRDGKRWGLSRTELEERRRVFWETITYDRIQSFTFGRPYAQSDIHHDCEMPQTCNTPLPSDDDAGPSVLFSHTKWHHHKFRFSTLMGRIVDRAFSATHSSYATIIHLDREINDFYQSLPEWILCPAVTHPVKTLDPVPENSAGMREDAQVYSLANMIFLTILHLHRGPFCRAVMLGPKDLEKSKFAGSVISLMAAARAIVNIARGLYSLHPALTCRMWYWIFHSFTAAVCQAVLVIAAPFHPLAPLALQCLREALELFRRADGERARTAAERVGRLADRAQRSMARWAEASHAAARDTGENARFPTSNLRGDPEDLLGASTKLIRLEPPQMVPPAASSPVLPSRDPASGESGASLEFGGCDFDWRAGAGELPAGEWQLDFALVDGVDLSSFIQSGADAWMVDTAVDSGVEDDLKETSPRPWFDFGVPW